MQTSVFASIIHKDDFPRAIEGFHRLLNLIKQQRHVLFFVIDRDNQRKICHGIYLLKRFRSLSTIMVTNSLKLHSGSQPKIERAFDGSEINKSTSAGR